MDIENTMKYSMMKGYMSTSVFFLVTHHISKINKDETNDQCDDFVDFPSCSPSQHVSHGQIHNRLQQCLDNDSQVLLVQRLSSMKIHEGEFPFTWLARFLDSLLEIPKKIWPKDSIYIDIFYDIYELGLNAFPKQLKPQYFDEIIGWIRIVEEAKYDYFQIMWSQAQSGDFPMEYQVPIQAREEEVFEEEYLSSSTDDSTIVLTSTADVPLDFDNQGSEKENFYYSHKEYESFYEVDLNASLFPE